MKFERETWGQEDDTLALVLSSFYMGKRASIPSLFLIYHDYSDSIIYRFPHLLVIMCRYST
jgi:hypothetical protein